mgnify:CR=1 FL=1
MSKETIFNIQDIQNALIHRYPFLLIDRVVHFEDGKTIKAIKNVTINEPFFQGHFPGRPVMPGVLILEAMAQTAAVLAMKSSKGIPEGKAVLLVGADQVKWKKMVLPGDVLEITISFIKNKAVFWYFSGEVKVNGELVAKANLSAAESD